MSIRVGIGYDIHRLAGGRPFVLGGVLIPYPQGPAGHSDGDVLLEKTLSMINEAGYHLGNLDATVIVERPILAPHLPSVRQHLAATLGVDINQVSVKAKTNEGVDAVGTRQAIAAHAVVLLEHA